MSLMIEQPGGVSYKAKLRAPAGVAGSGLRAVVSTEQQTVVRQRDVPHIIAGMSLLNQQLAPMLGASGGTVTTIACTLVQEDASRLARGAIEAAVVALFGRLPGANETLQLTEAERSGLVRGAKTIFIAAVRAHYNNFVVIDFDGSRVYKTGGCTTFSG